MRKEFQKRKDLLVIDHLTLIIFHFSDAPRVGIMPLVTHLEPKRALVPGAHASPRARLPSGTLGAHQNLNVSVGQRAGNVLLVIAHLTFISWSFSDAPRADHAFSNPFRT